jgi:Tat protein translocase TatB subunit
MFGIGTWELILILVLALIILGPSKLPEVARLVGHNLAKLRQAADDVKREVNFDQIKSDLEDAYSRPLQHLTERPIESTTVKDRQDSASMPGPAPLERSAEPIHSETDKKD